MSDEELDLVDTADLIKALVRRSRVFFVCMRPAAHDPEHDWSRTFAVDGHYSTKAEDSDRVLGLIQRACVDLLAPSDDGE